MNKETIAQRMDTVDLQLARLCHVGQLVDAPQEAPSWKEIRALAREIREIAVAVRDLARM